MSSLTARSFLCLWTSLRRNLSEDRENYDQSQTKTWKSTKKTVKTTTKVRQNYKLGGQKKMKKPKFLENGGFLWKIRHSGVNEIKCFTSMTRCQLKWRMQGQNHQFSKCYFFHIQSFQSLYLCINRWYLNFFYKIFNVDVIRGPKSFLPFLPFLPWKWPFLG